MSEFQIAMLASGSKGNATLISNGQQQFLVDIGISCRALTSKMKEAGTSPENLDGVFLTHEHIDHIRGLNTFLKKYQVPVYSSCKTWQAILAKYNIERKYCRVIESDIKIGDVKISKFAIPHDAADPHGYNFYDSNHNNKCTYLTDAGFVTETIKQAVNGSETLILEANHDLTMLKTGPYPYYLKQRILSTKGHLSNDSAGLFLSQMKVLPQCVMLAHLSEQNNQPKLALDTVNNFLEQENRLQETQIFVAKQDKIITNF